MASVSARNHPAQRPMVLSLPLSYRNLEKMMRFARISRGLHDNLSLDSSYAPELDKRCRAHLKQTNDSWRVDKTYIKVKGQWKYLDRAVDSEGNTLDFMLSAIAQCSVSGTVVS